MKATVTLPDNMSMQQLIVRLRDFLQNELGEFAIVRLLRDEQIGTSVTRVPHGLRQVPTGWTYLSPKGGVSIWEAQDPDDTYLYLQASSSLTTTIVVL